MTVQWVHLGPGRVLVASSQGAWLQQPQLGAFGFRRAMAGSVAGSAPSTKHLLEGAIAAAELTTPPDPEPPMTPVRWAWLLVNQWYTAHHSVALLPAAIDRYRWLERPDLVKFAQRKLEEERGHDQFSLGDLTALGYDARPAVAAVPVAPNVNAAIEHARKCVHGQRPVDFIGYIYALERSVIRISEPQLAALDAILPAGVDATSAVRAHAGELDLAHVDELVEFVAGLPAEDRAGIALSAHRTTAVLCAGSPDPHPSEGQLERWLARFRSAGPQVPEYSPQQGRST